MGEKERTHVEGPRDVLSGSSLREEGGETVVVGGRRSLHDSTVRLEEEEEENKGRKEEEGGLKSQWMFELEQTGCMRFRA